MTDQAAAIAAIVVLLLSLLAPVVGALVPKSQHDRAVYMPAPDDGVLPFQ